MEGQFPDHVAFPCLPGLACCPSLWASGSWGQLGDFGRPAARRPSPVTHRNRKENAQWKCAGAKVGCR